MDIQPRQIRNYVAPNGREPFEEWLDSIRDKKTQVVILRRLERLRTGNRGDCRHLGDSLYELRIHYGSGLRVYFAEWNSAIVILLCAGDKGSQQQDIQKAQSYWQEFKQRNHE